MMTGFTNYTLHFRVFIYAAILMAAYEGLKQWIGGDSLSLWASHLITIIVGALASVLASHYILTISRRHEEKMLALEQAANAFRSTLLDSIPVAVFYKDREGRYLGCNRLFSEIMGVSHQDIKGQTVEELWPGEMAKTYHQKDLELMAAPQTQQYEFKVKDKHGRTLDVIYGKSVFRDANGQVAGIIGTFFDISAKKRVELELAQYRGHLEDLVKQKTEALEVSNKELALAKDVAEVASQAKSAFLQTMAHELRTPLNGVLGMGQLLQMSDLDNEQQEMTATILSCAQSLLRMVDDILRYIELQDGLQIPAVQPFDLRELMQGIQREFEATAMSKGIRLVTEVSDQVPQQMFLDPVLMGKAIEALVKNAIAFTNSGEVRITCTQDESEKLMVSVQDTGCGMSAVILDRLFEPFYQADGTSTRTHGGIGLGLALTKRIISSLGGCISVTSTPQVGSCFRIELHSAQQQ